MATTEYFNKVLAAFPDSLKEATGMVRKISDNVSHITSLEFQKTTWYDQECQILMVCYVDGFQVWRVEEEQVVELLSRRDQCVSMAKVINTHKIKSFFAYSSYTPIIAVVYKQSPTIVNLYSVPRDEIVHVIRCRDPVSRIDSNGEVMLISAQGRLSLYDVSNFSPLYSVKTANVASPAVAIGDQWIIYASGGNNSSIQQQIPLSSPNLDPSGASSLFGISSMPPTSSSTINNSQQQHSNSLNNTNNTSQNNNSWTSSIFNQISKASNFGRRTLDQVYLPTLEAHAALDAPHRRVVEDTRRFVTGSANAGGPANVGGDSLAANTSSSAGVSSSKSGLKQQSLNNEIGNLPQTEDGSILVVRHAASGRSLGTCLATGDGGRPLSRLWLDPSGLLLFGVSPTGHSVHVFRANPVRGGGAVDFVKVAVLQRGLTPALVCDISCSPASRLVTVSSSKGTVHFYVLPPGLETACVSPSSHVASLQAVGLSVTPLTLVHEPDANLCIYQPSRISASAAIGTDASLRDLRTIANLASRARPRVAMLAAPLMISSHYKLRLGSTLLQEPLFPNILFLPSLSEISFMSGDVGDVGALTSLQLALVSRTGSVASLTVRLMSQSASQQFLQKNNRHDPLGSDSGAVGSNLLMDFIKHRPPSSINSNNSTGANNALSVIAPASPVAAASAAMGLSIGRGDAVRGSCQLECSVGRNVCICRTLHSFLARTSTPPAGYFNNLNAGGQRVNGGSVVNRGLAGNSLSNFNGGGILFQDSTTSSYSSHSANDNYNNTTSNKGNNAFISNHLTLLRMTHQAETTTHFRTTPAYWLSPVIKVGTYDSQLKPNNNNNADTAMQCCSSLRQGELPSSGVTLLNITPISTIESNNHAHDDGSLVFSQGHHINSEVLDSVSFSSPSQQQLGAPSNLHATSNTSKGLVNSVRRLVSSAILSPITQHQAQPNVTGQGRLNKMSVDNDLIGGDGEFLMEAGKGDNVRGEFDEGWEDIGENFCLLGETDGDHATDLLPTTTNTAASHTFAVASNLGQRINDPTTNKNIIVTNSGQNNKVNRPSGSTLADMIFHLANDPSDVIVDVAPLGASSAHSANVSSKFFHDDDDNDNIDRVIVNNAQNTKNHEQLSSQKNDNVDDVPDYIFDGAQTTLQLISPSDKNPIKSNDSKDDVSNLLNIMSEMNIHAALGTSEEALDDDLGDVDLVIETDNMVNVLIDNSGRGTSSNDKIADKDDINNLDNKAEEIVSGSCKKEELEESSSLSSSMKSGSLKSAQSTVSTKKSNKKKK